MPESFRATIAPSTAVATPVTFTGTWSSNIFAESANDMSIASTLPAAKVLTRPAGEPGTTLYSACQPRLPRRSSLWMISHAAQPSWRYAKRTLPFPCARPGRAEKPPASAAPAASAGPQEIPPLHVPLESSHPYVLLATVMSVFTRTSASTATSRPADAIRGLRSSSSTAG